MCLQMYDTIISSTLSCLESYCLYMPWRVDSWPFSTCLRVCRPLQKGNDDFTDVLCTVLSEIHMPGREGPYIKPIAQ